MKILCSVYYQEIQQQLLNLESKNKFIIDKELIKINKLLN